MAPPEGRMSRPSCALRFPYVKLSFFFRSSSRSSRFFGDCRVSDEVSLQALQALTSPSIYTSTIVASMCILKGVKRFQAVRPRACKKPPALDRDPPWRHLGIRGTLRSVLDCNSVTSVTVGNEVRSPNRSTRKVSKERTARDFQALDDRTFGRSTAVSTAVHV